MYTLAVGGVEVDEPGADLGLVLALASAQQDVAVPADLVACGEVGLGGEIRQVTQLDAAPRRGGAPGVPAGARATLGARVPGRHRGDPGAHRRRGHRAGRPPPERSGSRHGGRGAVLRGPTKEVPTTIRP